MRRFLAVLIALLPALPALADEVTTYTLDNGMEVVVIEDHRAPVVVHQVWYRAGAADGPPGKSGIAHYLEHLLFKGTDDMAEGELSDTVARNGGSDNAFTHWDYTGYWQRVAADRLELMMRMEADRMRDLQLDDTDILAERQVILEERNERVDSNPYRLFGEQRMAALYMNHPYGIPVIGWRHEMEQLDLEDALSFYERYYAPNNAILIVAGDVDPEEVHDLAQTHYGPLAPTPGLGTRTRPQEPPQLAERRMVFEDPRISNPYLSRDYLAPPREPGDQDTAAALVILSEILGGNDFTSVLPAKLVHEDQTALYAWAYYSPVSYDTTSFGIGVQPVPGVSLEEAEQALDAALAEFMEEGIDPDQFERVKFQLRAALIYAEDSTQQIAERYGRALTAGLSVEDIQSWPDVLQAVTVEDVMAAAEMVLDRNHAVTGWGRAPAPEQAAAEEEVTQ